MAKKQFVIFPFNGNGLEALDCMDRDRYDFFGFIDDDPAKTHDKYNVFNRGLLWKHKELYVLAVPGSPVSYRERARIIASLRIPEKRFISLIHPEVAIGRSVQIGINCLVMAGVVLTSNAVIGNHVCILPNSVVHHDTVIGDYTLIGSNVSIAGSCIVGRNCYVGSGSNIMQGLHIGDYSLIGLGSNVIRNVEEESKMVGNPARNLNVQVV